MKSPLYRKGDRFYSSGFELYADERTLTHTAPAPIHWHDYCEAELILSGQGRHEMSGRRYPLRPGCVYLITPMDFHNVIVEGDTPLQLYHVQFGCSVLSPEIMQRISALTPGIAAQLEGPLEEKVRGMFSEILTEFTERREDSPAMLRACLERLCLLILRESERTGQVASVKTHAEENDAVHQAIQYIQYNFRNPISLADAARLVHLSNNYFGELFHARLGMTFHEYLRQQRLSYACRLISETDLRFSEIARESGFQSLSYFTEIFKAAHGLTPTQFRQIRHTEEDHP